MFESLLSITNFCWSGDAYHNAPQPIAPPSSLSAPPQGRFAFAVPAADGGVLLARDRLGLNKLFVAIHESGTVVAANYLIDLVRRGVPFESIYSVPAGHLVRIAPTLNQIEVTRAGQVRDRSAAAAGSVDEVARDVRAALELWLSRLAGQFGNRPVCICLSGGLDSGLLAALARQYFSDLTAYTYSFAGRGMGVSEDAVYAERLARALHIPFRLIPATASDIHGAVDAALCYGQDWRDFNVHCGIVNEIVARAIRDDADRRGGPLPLVLTGDLANEFLADYAPVAYGSEEFYKLPRMQPFDLRRMLIRGLDSGDREVGIFNRHGLEVVQLYGLIVNEYHRLPPAFIGGTKSKHALVRKIAGDLLPDFLFMRPKVRAQVGDSTAQTGILPLLIQRGHGADWLRRTFCRLFNIENAAFLDRFIRGGRYRGVRPFSEQRLVIDGYFAG
jgi:asparagine synthetase B (glutamine-hydrolysing)